MSPPPTAAAAARPLAQAATPTKRLRQTSTSSAPRSPAARALPRGEVDWTPTPQRAPRKEVPRAAAQPPAAPAQPPVKQQRAVKRRLSITIEFQKSKRLADVVCEGSLAEVKAALPQASAVSVHREEAKVREAGGRSLVLLAATQRTAGDGDTAEVCRYLAQHLGLSVALPEGASRRQPLWYAAKAGHGEGVQLLLDMGAEPECLDAEGEADLNGQTPLFYAAKAGSPEACDALVAAGASVERRDKMGQTALFYAASMAHGAACVELLHPEGELLPRDLSGRTPLFVAASQGHAPCVEALLRLAATCGGGVADVDRLGQTALFFASAGGHLACVQALLDAGAAVDATDNVGQTPLFYAASKRQLDTCRALVARGADAWMEDKRGQTPLSLALLQHARRPEQTTALAAFFRTLPGSPEAAASAAASPPRRPAPRGASRERRASVEEAPRSAPAAKRQRRGSPVAKGLSDTEEESDDAQPCGSDPEPEEEATPAAQAAGGTPATPDDGIGEWLQGLGLAEYAEALLAEGYDEVALLASLGPAEVEEMLTAAGVAKAGHRLKLRHALRALGQESQ